MSAISLDDVTYSYPKAQNPALFRVSLQIPKGSFFAMLGPNGAGKTTLLRLLCGRFSDFNGRLSVEESLRNDQGFLDSKCYGVLLENPGVYPRLTVSEYLSYFAGFYGFEKKSCMPGGKIRKRMKYLASCLSLPSLDCKMSELSLGNRQKVQILRALLSEPSVLILDEPVANLDPLSREVVWKLVEEWRAKKGGTAIVSSHVLAEMDQYATHYAIIDGGKILRTGPVSEATAETSFVVKVSESVGADAIKSALAAAGISGAEVFAQKHALASIYRDCVLKDAATDE